MEITINFYTIIIAFFAIIPSAISSMLIFLWQRKIKERDDRDKEERLRRQSIQDEKDAVRERFNICMLDCIVANIGIAEATARAVKRLPDAHCNGDMDAAMKRLHEVQARQEQFLQERAVKSFVNN